MNDDELMTAVRESFADVHSATPEAQIARRGRTVRARRRVPGVTAAVGAATAAGVAVSVARPAGHMAPGHPSAGHPVTSHPAVSHSPSGTVQLTAWTVTRRHDGTIQVTFRQLEDAARLQRILRADGVPVSVTFTSDKNPACHGPVGRLHTKVLPFSFSRGPQYAHTHPLQALVIRPSALPPGVGLQISSGGSPGGADNFLLGVMLVRTSPKCTGS